VLAFGGIGKESSRYAPRSFALGPFDRAGALTRFACSHRFPPLLMALKNGKGGFLGRQVPASNMPSEGTGG
jgi:hypothetical protein